MVVFNPLCPVWFSLLLYCIYFCFSVPNKTISILLTANRCDPVPVVQNAVPDSYLTIQGSTVHYTCIDGFTPLSSFPQLTVCDGVNWTQTELPGCESKHNTSYNNILLHCACIITFYFHVYSKLVQLIHKFSVIQIVAVEIISVYLISYHIMRRL